MFSGNIANIQTINIDLIQAGDEIEGDKLLHAASNDGVFYLDLQEGQFRAVVDIAQDIFALSRELFAMSEEEKLRYDVDKLSRLKMNGYKPVGRNYGGLRGNRDGFESYVIPGNPSFRSKFPRPPLVTKWLPTLAHFFDQLHKILAILLSSLSTSLNLPHEIHLTNFHRPEAASTDILRLLHYVCQPNAETGVPQAPHTDLGSLTLLFANAPGLQVLPRDGTEWAYVLPKPHCAIVNIGDGLSMLTGGLLHPCLHRVNPFLRQSMEERYSIAYLQRAEDNVVMKSLLSAQSNTAGEMETLTSREWLEKKFGVLRRGPEGQLMKGFL